MGRIFGAVLREAAGGERKAPGDIIRAMSEVAGRGAGAAPAIAGNAAGLAALGASGSTGGFIAGVTREEGGGRIVSFCGYMPGLKDLFARSDIDAGIETGAGLIALYIKAGPRFLEDLPGMWMLALYDGPAGKLLLASDRNGYFPIYYSSPPDRFVFSSSLRAVVSTIGKPAADRGALMEYLFFDAVYGGATCYSDIRLLPYGAYLVLDTKSMMIEEGRYFRYEGLFDIDRYNGSRRIDAPAALTSVMRESLGRIRGQASEDTFGLLCGGGIDCSYLGGVMKEIGMNVPIFCSSVADVAVSEEEMARTTVERLGTGFHVAHLTSRNYYPRLLRSIRDFGQPIAHPNLARFYISAWNAARHNRANQIKGVASDLLFGGQGNVRSFYRYLRLSKYLSFVPAGARRVLTSAFEPRQKTDLELRLRNPLPSLSSIGMGNLERGAASTRILLALGGIRDADERAVKALMMENLCEYQQPLLNRRYEMAELHGLALWFPFLDTEVVRFAVNLPVGACVGWNTSKKVVREAARPYLGGALASRAKWGGDVPTAKWVRPLKFLLDDGFIAARLGFDPSVMGPVLDADIKLLWNLIDIELWGRMCLLGEDPRDLLAAMKRNGLESDPFESDPEPSDH
jgi:asparagine synthase (glutamine-hydrolysing)